MVALNALALRPAGSGKGGGTPVVVARAVPRGVGAVAIPAGSVNETTVPPKGTPAAAVRTVPLPRRAVAGSSPSRSVRVAVPRVALMLLPPKAPKRPRPDMADAPKEPEKPPEGLERAR